MRQRCVSKDVGPRMRVDLVGSHIDWRKERVLARTLGLEGGGGVDSKIPRRLERRMKHFL